MRFEAEQSGGGAALATTALAPTASLHGAMANTLGDLIDGIAALDRMEASLAAYKAELIDQARRWSEVTEQSLGGSDGGWNAEVRARRVIASELACALRIPERSAESLIADSAALVDLPQTFGALSAGTISWRRREIHSDPISTFPAPACSRIREKRRQSDRQIGASSPATATVC